MKQLSQTILACVRTFIRDGLIHIHFIGVNGDIYGLWRVGRHFQGK